MAEADDHSDLIRQISKARSVRRISAAGSGAHYELTGADGTTVEIRLQRGRATWAVWLGKEMLSNPETSLELALEVTHWSKIGITG